MKLNNNVLLVVGLFICLIMGCLLWYAKTPPNISKTDTIFHTDTLKYVDSIEIIKPIPKIIKVIKTDTVFNEKGDTIELVKESKKYQDTIICAKDTMEVTSYISGYDATLDSLKVNLSKQEVIKTIEITKYITPKKKLIDHFKVGPSVTAGYDVCNKQWGIMTGISVVYNF